MKHYIAIAEPGDAGSTWWISFPGLDSITSAADDAQSIAGQARDALASAVDAGMALPPPIEYGMVPLYEHSDYANPLVVLVPFDANVAFVTTA